MPTEYPVLDNRPIDQWKVTELREELRRRKITTKGLKEELVKRLDKAIHNEKESVNEGELNSGFDPESYPQDICEEEVAEPGVEDKTEDVGDISEKTGYDATVVDSDINSADVKLEHGDSMHDASSDVNRDVKVDDGDTIHDACSDGTDKEAAVTAFHMEDKETDNQSVKTLLDSSDNDSRYGEDSKLLTEDFKRSPAEPNYQVSEVSPDFGFQVKCESISTISVSINEKNELKDNLNVDNFPIELEVIKPEMVQPSSSNAPPIVDDLLQMDDYKEPGKSQASLDEIDAKYDTNAEITKKDNSADGGSPEKLNLDRSSGDESMEEDVLESKHTESNNKFDELGERTEVCKVNSVEEGTLVDAMVDDLFPENDTVEEKLPAAPIEKRKPEDNGEVRINANSKRQRRWNSESIKVPELQSSNINSSSTPKGAFQPTPRHSFTRSDSTLNGDSLKERIVPPSQKPATNSLRIDCFLRPFTLKAVQELLGKTGTVCNFWMDHIKTHCYVTYSSVEEATSTRNSVYNLQWPPNGGRLLVAEFVDSQEVKIRAEAPPQSPVPISPTPTTPMAAPPFQQPQAPPQPTRQHNTVRQQLPPPPPLLPPPPPLSDPSALREQLPPPPPTPKKTEPHVVTLDDLFKKTKATPRIYYLPLPEEQVAAKLAAQSKIARV